MEEILSFAADKIIGVPKDTLKFIVYSGSRGENGFITVFFYHRKTLVLIAKISRSSSQKQRLNQEYENLLMVSKLLADNKLSMTIEKPHIFVHLSGYYVLFKSVKSGVSGDSYLSSHGWINKRKVKSFLSMSIGWLIDFMNATAEYHKSSYDVKESAIQSLTGLNNPPYLESISSDENIFVGPCHGDFVAKNLLVSGSNVNVIDFENFTMTGIPAIDLMSIIVDTGTTVFGLNDRMISKTFYERNWFSNAVTEQLILFCSNFHIDFDVLTNIMMLYSDRAIYLCRTLKMDRILNFHQQLNRKFKDNKSEIALKMN